MEKNLLQKLLIGMTLFLLAGSLSSCANLGSNTVILTSKDKIYVVPENTKLEVIWDKKKVVITTDEDMLLMYKGTYFESIQEKNEDAIR